MLDSVEEIKITIEKIKEKRDRELAMIPIVYDKSSNEWFVVNWKANHDISRLENLMFDLKYNKTTIDKKEVAKLEKHLYKIGVLD